MSTIGIINGKLIRLYDGSDTIGQSTSCSLDLSTQMRSISHKDSGGYQENLPGEISGTISVENFYSNDASHGAKELTAKQLAGTLVSWKMSSEVTGDTFWSGTGYISSGSLSFPNEDNSTSSFTITCTGTITQGVVS